MGRITYYEIEGKQYALNFSTNAAEKMLERFGDYADMNVAIGITNRDEEKAGAELQTATTGIVNETVWLLALLMREGADYEEFVGKERPEPLTEKQIRTVLGRNEILGKVRLAVIQAINAGLGVTVEVEENPKNGNATQDE